MIEITETEALNRVAAYCSTAEHCRAEIAEKLQRWGIAYDAIDRIINRLEQEKYIDEERFCRAFINDKYRFANEDRAGAPVEKDIFICLLALFERD
jgi:regulatory protein